MLFHKHQLLFPLKIIAAALLVATFVISSNGQAQAHNNQHGFYRQTNLVSDIAGKASVTDPNLKNPWGITFGPQTPIWVADNAVGRSTLYQGTGQIVPVVVTVPPPAGQSDPSAPTGIAFNDSSDFVISNGTTTVSSRFIFATEDGTIAGWSPNLNSPNAITTVDNSAKGAVYKGLASGVDAGHNQLYATNFHAGTIDVFDAQFHWVKSFTDRFLPRGYAPFGIRNINGLLFVTFALQDADKQDDVEGAGHGFVDIFSTDGHLLKRLISHSVLNSPWGLAMAPDGFGRFSSTLLVGNFGDGRINAFKLSNGAFQGTLRDEHGHPLVNDGLWGLSFGNGVSGATDSLFFTAGLNDEQNGLFGSINFVA
ncbi:MAG: TIGR03118 family protein [Ktedonobacteraceae bacterium]|nr:TIGR03118 family protein [Ktedonobacteraceae bacterium]